MATNRRPESVTTMVCMTCGAEQFFDAAVPDQLTCPRCGSTVFRQYSTPTAPDEAALSRMEDEARSVSYGDASPTTAPDDVRDLEST